MKWLYVFLYTTSILWIGFCLGTFLGERRMVYKVAKATCSIVVDRYRYELCILSVEKSFKESKVPQ